MFATLSSSCQVVATRPNVICCVGKLFHISPADFGRKPMEKFRAWLGGTPISLAPELLLFGAASLRALPDMNWSRFGRKLLAPTLFASAALAIVSGSAAAAAPVQASCHLQSAGNKIKRVVYLQFDNVHLRRDNPN